MLRHLRYLIAFLLLAMMSAIYQSVLFWLNAEASEPLLRLCGLLSVLMLAMWVDADSKGRANVYRPHDFGFLVFLYWLPYLPFYLWRTRRVLGLLMLLGLICIIFLGDIVVVVIDIAR